LISADRMTTKSAAAAWKRLACQFHTRRFSIAGSTMPNFG
jgi:hypothetical protein